MSRVIGAGLRAIRKEEMVPRQVRGTLIAASCIWLTTVQEMEKDSGEQPLLPRHQQGMAFNDFANESGRQFFASQDST